MSTDEEEARKFWEARGRHEVGSALEASAQLIARGREIQRAEDAPKIRANEKELIDAYEGVRRDMALGIEARDKEIAHLRTTLDALAEGLRDLRANAAGPATAVAIENLLRAIAAAKAAGGGG